MTDTVLDLPAHERPSDVPRRRKLVQRHYEAAGDTRINQKHWKDATAVDIDSALAPKLSTLRRRAR